MICYQVHVPEELIPDLTEWLNNKGYGINGTGARVEGDGYSSTPNLYVWKHQNNPPPSRKETR